MRAFFFWKTTIEATAMQGADVVADTSLKDLPYKIELNRYGQIIMTPHWPIHSEIQIVLQDEFNRWLESGRAVLEYAFQTAAGVRVADVVCHALYRCLMPSRNKGIIWVAG